MYLSTEKSTDIAALQSCKCAFTTQTVVLRNVGNRHFLTIRDKRWHTVRPTRALIARNLRLGQGSFSKSGAVSLSVMLR